MPNDKSPMERLDSYMELARGYWGPEGEAISELVEIVKAQETALRAAEEMARLIATEHVTYHDTSNSQYEIGVVDGHRCAAKHARAYLAKFCGEKEE